MGIAASSKVKTLDSTSEQIKKWADKARDTWLTKNLNEETVTRLIHDWMDKQRDKIMLKAMGFSDSWHSWEIDHCNGRKTAVGDIISQIASIKFKEWLLEEMGKGFPVLTQEQKNAVMKEFRDNLYHYARNNAEALGEKMAAGLIEKEFILAPKGESEIDVDREGNLKIV